MSLVEVIVAMGLFLILITSSMSVLLVSLRTTEVNRDRVGAANLAGRELEIVRDQFNATTRGPETVKINQVTNENPLIGAPQSPVVLDNVRYTVVRTAQWSAVGAAASTASTCDNGTNEELAYLRVNVKVSWDRMSGNPISMDTILTPPKGTYSSTTGHIGVKLIDAAGQPIAGHTLTAAGPSGTFTGISASDGCTVFPFLDVGSYTVTVNDNNYVGIAGTQLATVNANVQAGTMWRGNIDYDRYASVLVSFTTLAGYSTPTDKDIPVSLGNEGLPLGSTFRTGLTDPRTIASLWPFKDGYQFWAGNCLDADPLKTAGRVRDNAVAAEPGGVTSVQVDLAPIHITATTTPDGTIVKAVHVSSRTNGPNAGSDTSCTSGDTITLGTLSGGKLDTSAPYGIWKIDAGNTPKPQVTLVRDDPPVPVNAVLK
jgi:type II secretory pathway pseudopilin PulG